MPDQVDAPRTHFFQLKESGLGIREGHPVTGATIVLDPR